jgi:hypothetical protein
LEGIQNSMELATRARCLRVGILFLFLLTVGCADNSSSGTVINVAGNWTFTTKSSNLPSFGVQYSASGAVNQSGSAISGSLSLSGAPCATTSAFSGTLSANTIVATLDENGQQVILSGTISSNGASASGSYSAPAGGCTNADFGTWTATRNSLTGAFRGRIQSDNSLPVDITAELREQDGMVTGSAAATNSVCSDSVAISGTVSGNEVELLAQTADGNTVAVFAGRLEEGGNVIRLDVSGACPYVGTVVLNRLSP